MTGRQLNIDDRAAEHLQTLYGVLLSVSLGILATGGAPRLLFTPTTTNYALHVWTTLCVGVLLFVLDSWLFFAMEGYRIRIEKPRTADPLKPVLMGFLFLAMIITAFVPWQFVMRAWTPHYLVHLSQPANASFTVNLMAGIACQILIIRIALARQDGEEERLAMSGQVRFVSIWRSLLLAVLGLIVIFVFLRNGSHDDPLWSVAILAVWFGARFAERGLWQAWEQRVIISRRALRAGELVAAGSTACGKALLTGIGTAWRRIKGLFP